MKRKKEMTIRLRKMNIANLNDVKAGLKPTDDSYYCTSPKECPTTVDTRGGSIHAETDMC